MQIFNIENKLDRYDKFTTKLIGITIGLIIVSFLIVLMYFLIDHLWNISLSEIWNGTLQFLATIGAFILIFITWVLCTKFRTLKIIVLSTILLVLTYLAGLIIPAVIELIVLGPNS